MINDKCEMINYKCPMINDKGFALITVIFIVASLISVVGLCAYLPISERRKAAGEFLTDMKDLRIKRAMFGRLADQRGGEFMSCGGLYSECGAYAGDVGRSFRRQIFTMRGYSNRHGDMLGLMPCEGVSPYRYDSAFGLWAGYRGKCYYYMLPSDESYDPYYYDSFGNVFKIQTQCNASNGVRRNFFGGNPRMCFRFRHKEYYFLEVRDYTKTPRDRISLELVSASQGEAVVSIIDRAESFAEYVPGSETMLLPHDSSDCGDYYLHIFRAFYRSTGRSGRKTDLTGLIKVLIRTKRNDDWFAVYSAPIVVPFMSHCKGVTAIPSFGITRAVIDMYVEEIGYYG